MEDEIKINKRTLFKLRYVIIFVMGIIFGAFLVQAFYNSLVLIADFKEGETALDRFENCLDFSCLPSYAATRLNENMTMRGLRGAYEDNYMWTRNIVRGSLEYICGR